MALLPLPKDTMEGIALKVYIGRAIWTDEMMNNGRPIQILPAPNDPVVSHLMINMRYADLHGFEFRVAPNFPFMRALFAKALMAFRQSEKVGDGLPDPKVKVHFDAFASHCAVFTHYTNDVKVSEEPIVAMAGAVEACANQDADPCHASSQDSAEDE
eukprot:6485007-Amphidinium_carterae.1